MRIADKRSKVIVVVIVVVDVLSLLSLPTTKANAIFMYSPPNVPNNSAPVKAIIIRIFPISISITFSFLIFAFYELYIVYYTYFNMSNWKSKKVLAAMSGGVDSSVAAALLKKRGFDVVGVHLKCWSGGSPLTGIGVASCLAEQDAEDARRAAEVLNIPFYILDFEKEYKNKVVKYMIEGYRSGITPNPDVMCNKEIKFGLFLKKALAMGADFVATGHYVRLLRRSVRNFYGNQNNSAPAAEFSFPSAKKSAKSGTNLFLPAGHSLRNSGQPAYNIFSLRIAKDKNKDQSYFLWTLTQEQLKHCLFPIGEYTKPEVRKMARKFGLPNADKKDSQGICFLGKVSLKEFLKDYIPEKKGIVLNTDGKVIGEHKGAHFYTIGQRGGLKLGGNAEPYYVAEKDVEENAILVAEKNHPVLYHKEIKLRNLNFINSAVARQSKKTVWVRVRYREPLAKANLIFKKNSRQSAPPPSFPAILVFEQGQKFVASGQSAVFYSQKGEMLGGGVIV